MGDLYTPRQAISAYLSPCVFLYRPHSPKSSPDVSTSPKIIILAVWMDARECDMAKHVVRYQTLHPDSTIVVIRSFFTYYFRPAAARRDLKAAVVILRGALFGNGNGSCDISTCPPSWSDKPEFLVHVFPNGGACMLYHLYQVWAEMNGEKYFLPPHITVFDEVPAGAGYQFPVSPVLFGIPSGWAGWLAFPKSYGLAMGAWIKIQAPVVKEVAVDWGRKQWKVLMKTWETM